MTTPTQKFEEKVVDLESRLAFQEDYLTAINARVAEQDQEIARLHLQLKHLYEKMESTQQGASGPSNYADERPPHY